MSKSKTSRESKRFMIDFMNTKGEWLKYPDLSFQEVVDQLENLNQSEEQFFDLRIFTEEELDRLVDPNSGDILTDQEVVEFHSSLITKRQYEFGNNFQNQHSVNL